MDFSRFLLAFCLLSFVPFLFASPSSETIGIAFVHGTSDHRLDAEGGYWKESFIQSVSQGLTNPQNYKVIACDFSQMMWHENASGCMIDQLLQYIDERHIDKLVVYTHSHGANMMRWVLSNPTYDARYARIRQYVKKIVAIAPSSGGTVLADEVMHGNVFESSLGWLLGYRTDSVRQQQIGDMAIYNDELLYGAQGRPTLPVEMQVIAGTDVAASPVSSSSYCNGYLLNAGLKLTKLYLDACADGFLSCTSQTTAGQLWFYDIQKTTDKLTLSHNQSRHNCFGLEQILINDLAQQGV